jgi:glutamate-1-semialdehyde 2,1-aminomutase
MSIRYRKSEELLAKARRRIPLGAQTFSKSVTQFPYGAAPYFAARAKGSRLWDIDGNEYVDFVNGLCAINLGYCDDDVDAAVRTQLESGVVFTLSHALESEVAEQLCRMVPCAEMVRFGKNGSDATAGAIRLARAHTGRDRVAACGYHGWQDWYIGATSRNRGVPGAVSELTHLFPYGDLAALENLLASRPGEFAAVILEPMNVVEPQESYLAGVKELAHRYGAILVFDETITGFRFAPGGAQQLFGVTPDLATFGKGMANGFPVSAVVGRADLMKLMEEIFFSFTFGGETLSLAAALATMRKVEATDATGHMATLGQRVKDGLASLISNCQLGATLSVSGHPAWSFLTIKDTAPYSSWDIKTLFLQEMFAAGILTLGTHNLSYAHTDEDVARLLDAYAKVLPMIRDALDKGDLGQRLTGERLKPLFRVR